MHCLDGSQFSNICFPIIIHHWDLPEFLLRSSATKAGREEPKKKLANQLLQEHKREFFCFKRKRLKGAWYYFLTLEKTEHLGSIYFFIKIKPNVDKDMYILRYGIPCCMLHRLYELRLSFGPLLMMNLLYVA